MTRLVTRSRFIMATLAGIAVWAPAELLARSAKPTPVDCNVTCPKGSCACTGFCKCSCASDGTAKCENVK